MSGGHIRQRSPGSFELRYRAESKTRTETFHGSKTEARKRLRELLTQSDKGILANSGRMTVADWLDQWLEIRRRSLAGQSYDKYEQTVRVHLIPALGAIRLDKLSRADISMFYARLDRAPRTLRAIHVVLRMALDRAIEDQLIAVNPAARRGKDLPQPQKRPVSILSPEQAMSLLNGAGALYPAILLAVATGARRGECLAMRWRNIDGSTVRFVESMEQRIGMAPRSKSTKTGKFRNVVLPPIFANMLNRWKLDQAEALLRLGIRQGPNTLVCQREDGSMLTPAMVTNGYPRHTLRVLGTRHHFHELRHSHASILLRANVPAKVVQERLGHSSIGVTMDTYGHVIAGMQEEAAAKLDDIFGQSGSK